MSEAPDVFTSDVIAVRRAMRELYEQHPQGFEIMITLIQRSGTHWLDQLPPIPKGADGSVLQVTREVLALLLADYLNRPRGVTKEMFAEASATTLCKHGHSYAVGTWGNAQTILDYIAKAQSLAKRESDFKALVAAWQDDLAEIGGPEVGGKAT